MTTAKSLPPPCCTGMFRNFECRRLTTSHSSPPEKLGFSMLCRINAARSCHSRRNLILLYDRSRSNFLKPIKAKKDSESSCTDNGAAFSGTIFFNYFFSDSFYFVGLKSCLDLESGISNAFCEIIRSLFICICIFFSSYIVLYALLFVFTCLKYSLGNFNELHYTVERPCILQKNLEHFYYFIN